MLVSALMLGSGTIAFKILNSTAIDDLLLFEFGNEFCLNWIHQLFRWEWVVGTFELNSPMNFVWHKFQIYLLASVIWDNFKWEFDTN